MFWFVVFCWCFGGGAALVCSCFGGCLDLGLIVSFRCYKVYDFWFFHEALVFIFGGRDSCLE